MTARGQIHDLMKYAVSKNDVATVQCLLKAGFSPNLCIDHSGYVFVGGSKSTMYIMAGMTLVHIAVLFGFYDILKLLISHGGDIRKKIAFHEIYDGCYNAVVSAMNSRIIGESRERKEERIQMCKFLISKYPDLVYARDSSAGWPPLMFAMRDSKNRLAKILLKAGAKFEPSDRQLCMDFMVGECTADLIKTAIKYHPFDKEMLDAALKTATTIHAPMENIYVLMDAGADIARCNQLISPPIYLEDAYRVSGLLRRYGIGMNLIDFPNERSDPPNFRYFDFGWMAQNQHDRELGRITLTLENAHVAADNFTIFHAWMNSSCEQDRFDIIERIPEPHHSAVKNFAFLFAIDMCPFMPMDLVIETVGFFIFARLFPMSVNIVGVL